MFAASTLETVFIQLPITAFCARHMHLVAARTLQAAQHGTVLLASTALMTNTTPDGRFQTNNPCPNDMYARCPNYTIFVGPNLVRIIVRSCHAIENINLWTFHRIFNASV